MANLDLLIKTCCELGAAQTIEAMGLASGEISRNRAKAVYGKYFLDAERQGRIRPVMVGNGKRGRKLYRVVDILALKAKDAIPAELR